MEVVHRRWHFAALVGLLLTAATEAWGAPQPNIAETAWRQLELRIRSGEIQRLRVIMLDYYQTPILVITPSRLSRAAFPCNVMLSQADRETLLHVLESSKIVGSWDDQPDSRWGVKFLNSNGAVISELYLGIPVTSRVVSSVDGATALVNSSVLSWLERKFPDRMFTDVPAVGIR